MASIINATTTNGVAVQGDNSGSLQLQTNNGTTAVTIDTSQNVGIGTSSPASYGGTAFVKTVNIGSLNTISAGFSDEVTGTFRIAHASGQNILNFDASALCFQSGGSTPTERMRITSGGIVRINNTSDATFSAQLNTQFTTSKNCGIYLKVTDTNSSQSMILFGNTTSDAVGGISTSGSATSYATSSDYRLKENIAPMTGALATVSQLKPCTYTWKVDGSAGQGFIAHELQAVVPDCVTGEKDAVETYTDEDGNEQTRIKPQGIDTSFLVATLTAAIQEQQAQIEELKAEVQALKGVA